MLDRIKQRVEPRPRLYVVRDEPLELPVRLRNKLAAAWIVLWCALFGALLVVTSWVIAALR